MIFFSHNNNTPITDYSSVLGKTELYKQFFKRGNSRSPHKKGKCKIFAGAVRVSSSEYFVSLKPNAAKLLSIISYPRKFSIRGFNSIFGEERGTKENFVK